MTTLSDQLQQGMQLLEVWKQQFTQAVANGGNGAGIRACPLKEWIETGLEASYREDPRYVHLQELDQRVQHEAMKILTLAKEDKIDEAMTGLNFSGDFYKVLSQLTNELRYWRDSVVN